jgi:hypothetical protein
LAYLQQPSGNEAAEGLVRRGTADVIPLRDLTLRQKPSTRRKRPPAQQSAQFLDELLVQGGHGGDDFVPKQTFDKWLSQFKNWLSQS